MDRATALAAAIALGVCGMAVAQDKAPGIAAQVCASCHAPDGNGTAPANPKIAGQGADYLHKQLRDFKAAGGKKPRRESPIMNGMVANLSEADMKGLAAFYAGQALKPAAAADKEQAALGQKLWRGGDAANGVPACAGCHGPAGAGMPAQYPRLAGQYAEYLAAQLTAFREGKRSNDASSMMRGVAARMNDRQIRAVAEYAAGLR
ncbi:MAG TPA: c-type cytochrome [Burkholderiales bacterium]|nr:c-type cytochrome [Burkholderiales bacterium]